MYSIGQLAKKAEVSNRTLRYYEELGLIQPNSRGENRYRYYDDTHLHRLNMIRILQDAGFALKEIVEAFSPSLDPQGNLTPTGQDTARKIFLALEQQRNKLIEHQKQLTVTIEELQKSMKSLKDCFGCKVSSSISDCLNCDKAPDEVTRMAFHHQNAQGNTNGIATRNEPRRSN